MKKNRNRCVASVWILVTLFLLYSSHIRAELRVRATVDLEYVDQDVEASDEGRRVDSTNTILRPTIAVDYQTKNVTGFWRANHNHIRRSLEQFSTTENYTNYTYGSSVRLLDNVVSASASGSLSYRSPSTNSFLVDDFLLNADQLSKTRTNQANLQLTLPESDYFQLSSNVLYSSTQSERNQSGFAGFDSDRYSMSTTARSGNDFKRFNMLFQGQYSVSDRGNNSDYTSRQIDVEMSYRLFSNLGVILTTTNEGNQVDGNDNIFSNSRNFNTYGAGLSWRDGENKFISVTYNTTDGDQVGTNADSQDDDSDATKFVGLNASWQFTPRTQLSASYSRRFFGESGSLSFNHTIKRFRTQVQYTEEVTSFSQLIANPENLGVFVCADGINDLSSCFQPDTIDYNLRPNEQFVQFSQPNSEISDELILRKSLSWQLGVNQRRTRFSINGRYSLNEYLESIRTNRTYSAGVALGFQIGQKTDLSWTTNYAVTNNVFDITRGETIAFTSALRVSRDIGRHFSASINFNYIDRETNGNASSGFQGINGDLIDRRVTLQIQYIVNPN